MSPLDGPTRRRHCCCCCHCCCWRRWFGWCIIWLLTRLFKRVLGPASFAASAAVCADYFLAVAVVVIVNADGAYTYARIHQHPWPQTWWPFGWQFRPPPDGHFPICDALISPHCPSKKRLSSDTRNDRPRSSLPTSVLTANGVTEHQLEPASPRVPPQCPSRPARLPFKPKWQIRDCPVGSLSESRAASNRDKM